MQLHDYVTAVLSSIAIILSLWSIWYTHRNFKMNAFEFNKRRKEEQQAVFKATAINLSAGRYKVNIVNVGQADATNVSFDFSSIKSSDDITVIGGKDLPNRLNAQQSTAVIFFCSEGKDNNPSFSVCWDDKYSKDNKEYLTVCLM